MGLECLWKLKAELKKKMGQLLKEIPLSEEIKEKISGFQYGSLHYQTYLKKSGYGNHYYKYHHLSANIKENGRWKKVSLKSIRDELVGRRLKELAILYNSLKKIEEIEENLKGIKV